MRAFDIGSEDDPADDLNPPNGKRQTVLPCQWWYLRCKWRVSIGAKMMLPQAEMVWGYGANTGTSCGMTTKANASRLRNRIAEPGSVALIFKA